VRISCRGPFSGGYLLLEVLFSLVILSSGLLLISRSFLSSMSATRLVQDHGRALLLLERKLAEVESGMIAVSGSPDETIGGDEDDLHWEIRLIPAEEGFRDEAPFVEVEVKVGWRESGKEREVLASLGMCLSREKPEWGPSGGMPGD